MDNIDIASHSACNCRCAQALHSGQLVSCGWHYPR